jgi:hypothetical protein
MKDRKHNGQKKRIYKTLHRKLLCVQWDKVRKLFCVQWDKVRKLLCVQWDKVRKLLCVQWDKVRGDCSFCTFDRIADHYCFDFFS